MLLRTENNVDASSQQHKVGIWNSSSNTPNLHQNRMHRHSADARTLCDRWRSCNISR